MSVFKCVGRTIKELSELEKNSFFVLKEKTDTPYIKLQKESILVINLETKQESYFPHDTQVFEIEITKFEYKLKVN